MKHEISMFLIAMRAYPRQIETNRLKMKYFQDQQCLIVSKSTSILSSPKNHREVATAD